jgi:hypothetical protein
MRTSTMSVVALLMLAIPALAGAQAGPKLAIGNIRGDASRVRRQILLELCEPYTCVAASRIVTDQLPDPRKLKAAGVAGYLGGAVTGEPGQRSLVLALTTPASTAHRPAHTWRFKLTPDGRLRPQALERITSDLNEALAGAAAQLPPPPAAPPQKAINPPPPAPKPPPAEAKPPPPVAKAPPAAKSEAPTVAAPEKHPAAAHGAPLRAAFEGGIWVTQRKLTYSGVVAGTTPLRTFDASGIFVPRLHLEIFPMAFTGSRSLFSGIGITADYGHSIGLQVTPPTGSTEGSHPATLTMLNAGLVWRMKPMSSSEFVLAPALRYRSLQLVTSAKGGVTIAGLPDARLSGYDLRLDIEAPVGSSLSLLAGGGYTFWTSGKDLVKGTGFFGSGSVHGLEAEAGISYRITGPLSARALFEYQSASYSSLGNPAPGIGTASGASDTYLGFRAMVRAEF